MVDLIKDQLICNEIKKNNLHKRIREEEKNKR